MKYPLINIFAACTVVGILAFHIPNDSIFKYAFNYLLLSILIFQLYYLYRIIRDV